MYLMYWSTLQLFRLKGFMKQIYLTSPRKYTLESNVQKPQPLYDCLEGSNTPI